MNFHEYLKQLIKTRNLKQITIANALEMDKSYLSRMLRNQHDSLLSCKTLEKLSDVLQCTTGERLELYRLAGKMPPELHEAFCSSAKDAKEIYSFVFGG